MSSGADAISLTRSLLAFDTINPPGQEHDCARHAGALLGEWGYGVEYHEYEPGRTSVIARGGGSAAKAPLCLTGHIDTVALGSRAWTKDPFCGETEGDRLYGRGSSDMKAGVAAILLAARGVAGKLAGTPGVVIVLTAAEENGCIGSQHLARTQLLGKAGAMIVGVPTANYPYIGHKGSVKFHASYKGVSAHGSMPHLGVNAIYKAARAVARLEAFDFAATPHPVMGTPTMNVGTMTGGSGVNMVPDTATIGDDAEMQVFSNLPPVWTPPDHEWIERVFTICQAHAGKRPQARTATYMTDAANLLKVYAGAPTVVLGPGEPQIAHQTDEWCSMERIRQAVAMYEALIKDWCRF